MKTALSVWGFLIMGAGIAKAAGGSAPGLLGTDNVICVVNGKVQVHGPTLDDVLFTAGNLEPLIEDGSTPTKTKVIDGVNYVFARAIFPGQGNAGAAGWVAQNYVKTKAECATGGPPPVPVPVSSACVPGKVSDAVANYTSKLTGYYPADNTMEGGFADRHGLPLNTLQDYLNGYAPYVSVAMDTEDADLPYGTIIRIPSLEQVYGRCIEFRVVDTGSAFEGQKTGKIDICNDDNDDADSDYVNGTETIYKVSGME